MTVKEEIEDLEDFNAWSGAEDTKRIICDNGKGELFMAMLENGYPEGITKTQLNDLLWFDREFCLELVGLDESKEDEE